MTKHVVARAALAQGSFARVLAGPFGRHIALDKENEGGADDAAAKAAAEAAAKEAADKAAAEAAKAEAEKKAKEEGDKKESSLSDSEAKLLKELMAEKNANKDLKGKATQLDALNKELAELGGIDALKALVAAKADADKKALEEKGEFETVKKMIVEENQKLVQVANDKAAAAEAEIAKRDAIIDELTIGAAFGSSAVVADTVLTPTKARQIFGAHFERVDGQIVGYDKPKGEAGRTQLIDGSGKPLSFDAALKKLVDADPDRERLMKSKLKQGAGSGTTDDSKTPEKSELHGASRIAAALAARKKA